MKIWLLTHSEELKKINGTGQLVKQALKEECTIIEWSRVSPSKDILALPTNNTLLVYLCENAQSSLTRESVNKIENIILIDGTWQQARKIHNHSPYLKRFPYYEIQGEQSIYSKRRNQKKIGLCTAEVAIHFLKLHQHSKTDALIESFSEFNQ
ncbi:DTW domain-containing protein [Marinomonas transparens]|uniref:tRNA-uridine aminocarboxypropyltransferase n=1 Tax=Marinomonas transparens TaxID=2795388 RepID=A0A934JPI5_9GAMM|nr:tRNA-uridine aminocarboxypropyltransferase [Marinomonas transparens]MBJ7538273.1 DTW domain-containing protein [Marinomonas transparens]